MSPICLSLKANLVVELVGCHQRPAGCGIGLARDCACARFPRDAALARIARDHGLADQRHRLEQKFDDGLARPHRDRLRPVDIGAGICQVGQNRRHRTCVPWLRIKCHHPDGALGVELLCGSLLSSHADPGEQDRGDDPAPFGIAEPPDRRAGRDGAVHLDDPTRTRDGGSGSVPVSPLPSFFGLPFSTPILPMKVLPSKSLRLTVRAARACGLASSGLRPSAESRMPLSVPWLIFTDSACPSVVPARIQYSKILRPLYGPSTTVSTASSISQSPFALRLSMPSSPTP